MKEERLALTSEKILETVFTPNVKGYDADEVDDFLDQIIKDYAFFERYQAESTKYITDLETQLRSAKEQMNALEMENARMSNRISGLKESPTVDLNNADLLQRITKLETALYQLGGDPSKIR